MNKKISFADHVDFMRRADAALHSLLMAAGDLRTILAFLDSEVKYMRKAHRRFAAKKPTKRSAKSAE